MIRFAMILALLLPWPAQAGPWPREVGQTFLSLMGERNRTGDGFVFAYAEYGLTPRTTLGVEFSRSSAETGAILWLQHPLDDGHGVHRITVQSGLGVVRSGDEFLPLAQGALSWGRGFERWGGGWMSAQLLARMTGASHSETETPDPGMSALFDSILGAERVVKADLTLGLRPRDGLMVINSLWLEDRQDDGFAARLAPSLVFDAPGPVQIELGVIQPLSGPAEQAVRLGTWLEF
ncbi:hypothetical protein [Paracoccus indicus]|uniref:hypothetical protein n=1 Tax=Paracoccus indicus TaxID=2079229 RepID=UPI000D353EAC|nr:hypothetical protein [Paracoccus indicus]